jgi:hypothetical protein
MGRHGPVPKRPEKRHGHRSKAENATTCLAGAATEAPPLNLDVPDVVADWYAALSEGAEAQFYTPALWQRARVAAVMLAGVLRSGRPSSQMYAALQKDMQALLVDAGELRRLGITVHAEEAELPGNVIDWRARVDGQRAERRARVGSEQA